MKTITQQRLRILKRRIKKRLAGQLLTPRQDPMFTASNIHYEVADRTRGLACGGIGAIHQLALSVGLVQALDRYVDLPGSGVESRLLTILIYLLDFRRGAEP